MQSSEENSPTMEKIQQIQKVQKIQLDTETKDKIIKYQKNEELIADLEAQVKELKKTRKILDKYFLDYLIKIGELRITFKGVSLRRDKKIPKIPINDDLIKEALTKEIPDATKVNELIKLIELKRSKPEQEYLKRTYKKQIDEN